MSSPAEGFTSVNCKKAHVLGIEFFKHILLFVAEGSSELACLRYHPFQESNKDKGNRNWSMITWSFGSFWDRSCLCYLRLFRYFVFIKKELMFSLLVVRVCTHCPAKCKIESNQVSWLFL